MADISKYLKTQLELSKKHKKTSPSVALSERSMKAAQSISRKQQPQLEKSPKELQEPVNKEVQKQKNTVREPFLLEINDQNSHNTDCTSSGSDSEYVPSDEELKKSKPKFYKSRHVTKTSHKYRLTQDDGDKKSYMQRVSAWRKAKEECKKSSDSESSNTGQVSNFHSADIDYLLGGNQVCDDVHKLDGGLLVPRYIWSKLYKYQRTGVKWLWELHQIESGGLLGDEMGLGKTVQIIAFLAALHTSNLGKWGGLGPSIIVAPATVIYQWVSHFHYWYPKMRVAVLHQSGSFNGSISNLIRDIHDSHGILIITYAGIVKFNQDLLARDWHYVMLDEGHKIRNPETQVSKVVKLFRTAHKILITGSPMQNSLQELWSLFDFMSPGLLGSLPAFMQHFALPITQGGYANATSLQEVTALEIAKSLKKIITPYMIRRTKSDVKEAIKLPSKNEQVLFCSLTSEQRDLYLGYLYSNTVRSILDKECRYGDPLRARILVALSTLRKICNHPDLYLGEVDEPDTVFEETFGFWKRSGKMIVVNSLLKIWKKQGHRALIFTQSRAMLCILENFLQINQYKYLKMDGSVSIGNRQNIIKLFNENDEYLVFLATTRVGGLGVNLTGADRVVIYDPDWNPATDSQAKERAWRIGQRRNVTVYRLLTAGTIEEKIYQRQVFKQLLSNKVLIDPNQKNVLSTSTLQGLFHLEEPNRDGDTETAAIFKHTKVELNKNNSKDNKASKTDKILLSGGVSFSKQKMEAMRKLAQSISSKISTSDNFDRNKATSSNVTQVVDPREQYKQKRKMLNATEVVEEPEVNIIDNQVTEVSFNDILSELDIINMHAKENYVENLISSTASNSKESDSKIDIGNTLDNKSLEEDNIDSIISSPATEETITDVKETNFPESIEEGSLRKRRHSQNRNKYCDSLNEKKIDCKKKKLSNSKKRKKESDDQDDYVLTKLFAKSGVKSALEHDQIMGLSDKEKMFRLTEEARQKAKDALKALRKSRMRDK